MEYSLLAMIMCLKQIFFFLELKVAHFKKSNYIKMKKTLVRGARTMKEQGQNICKCYSSCLQTCYEMVWNKL